MDDQVVQLLQEGQTRIEAKLDTVIVQVAEMRGEKRVWAKVQTLVAGGVGAAFSTLLAFLFRGH